MFKKNIEKRVMAVIKEKIAIAQERFDTSMEALERKHTDELDALLAAHNESKAKVEDEIVDELLKKII